MIVTNYPNPKDPQQQFDFRDHQPIKSIGSKQKKSSKKPIKKTSNNNINSQGVKKQVGKTSRTNYNTQNMSKTHGNLIFKAQGTNQESYVNSQKNIQPSQTEYGQFYQDSEEEKFERQNKLEEHYKQYDLNEEIRQIQIEKQWNQRVQLVQKLQEDQDEEKKLQELQVQVKQLRKYKNWCERVFKCSSNNEDFKKLNQKIFIEQQFQAHIEQDEKNLQQKIGKKKDIQKQHQELLDKKNEQLNDLKQQIQLNEQKLLQKQQEIQMIKSNVQKISGVLEQVYQQTTDFAQKKINKKSTNKKVVITLLTQSLQDIEKALNEIKK